MSQGNIILCGDWEAGLVELQGALAANGFSSSSVAATDLRAVLKRKLPEALVFATTAAAAETILKRMEEVFKFHEGFPVLIYGADLNVEMAVDFVRRGAVDVCVQPLKVERLIERLAKSIRLYNLTARVFGTQQDDNVESFFEEMIGRSRKMQENFRMIAAVAKSNATVLITGESGTGKELVARAIHRLSDRTQNRFVDINCGAIPRDLLENELFGHEKGSFTGAHKRYAGSFEAAHQGTLFLDEISEMDVHLQVKLLRVLQERSFTRIGSNERIAVDVRIIAATNRNLSKTIEKGEFREDLFYRLNVINIEIPALRERREDVPLLAKHFLDYYAAKNNRIMMDIAPDAIEALINYSWPGNVRELENTIERVVVLNDVSQIKLKHLPVNIQKVDRSIGYMQESEAVSEDRPVLPLEDLERQAIEAALMKFHGNVAIVAKKLKIGQATLYRKVKKFGIAL